MQIDDFRDAISDRLVDFSWNQWSQMGVSAPRRSSDARPVDPEALLLLSFEAGRDDPRLFGELADWLIRNQGLVSFRRLQNLSGSPEDKKLIGATLGWAGDHGLRGQKSRPTNLEENDPETPVPFFRRQTTQVRDPEPAFQKQHFMMSSFSPSGKAREPDLLAPINLAFRLRLILGTGVRSELIRALIGPGSKAMSVKELANEVAYSKRNVQEAINDLRSAGVLREVPSLSNPSYSISSETWFQFLGLPPGGIGESLPWPRASFAFRTLLRWAWRASSSDMSEYMLASEAGRVYDLAFSGFRPLRDAPPIGNPGQPGYWERFTEFSIDAADALGASDR